MVAPHIFRQFRLHSPVGRAVVAGLLYFIVATITISATSNGRNHAAIWLADAIVLAVLLDLPRRQWTLPLLLGVLANHLANDVTRGFEAAHLLYGVINMGQVWLAAWLLRHKRVSSLLADLPSLGRFVFWAGVVAPALGAALGALTSLWLYGQPLAPSFLRWFASNSLGLLVATPFFKAAFDGSVRDCWHAQSERQRRQMGGTMMAFTLVVAYTFLQQSLPLLFLPVSALVVVAVLLGRIGVKIAVLIAAVIATSATLDGNGPISLVQMDEFIKAAFFQFYLGILMATGMMVVSLVASHTEAMAQLADREQMLRQILAQSTEVVLSFDEAGKCTYCGGPAEAMLGRTPQQIRGMTIVELAQAVALPLLALETVGSHADRAPRTMDIPLPGSPTVWLQATMSPIWYEDRLTSSVISLRDITSQRQREAELNKRAFVDELTQVSNRAGFLRRVEKALGDGKPHALALIDIDWFKSINDTFGHASGDEALVVVAEIITAHVRDGDVVGRIGGDEFAVLFHADTSAAVAACKRIRDCIASTEIMATDRRRMSLSISCGLASAAPGTGFKELFQVADRALYEVKERGRNDVRLAA